MAARIIMFASGKGGTGKSTLSVLVGSELAALGRRVLLIELDSGLRSVDIIAGVSGDAVYDIGDLLSGRCAPEKAVLQSGLYPGFSVICAPYSGGEVQPKALETVCARLSPAFDYLLVDTAAGLGAPLRAAAAVAEQAAVVVTPDRVCLRDGRLVADLLQDAGVAGRLLINRFSPVNFPGSGLRDLDECIDTVSLQLLGLVPEDAGIHAAAVSGVPLSPGTARRAVQNTARRIAGEYVPLALG